MGLFSSKPKQNIFEIFDVQLHPELEKNMVEENKTEDYTDFSIGITENFDLFDKAVFRFFGDKPDLSGNTSFNLFFKSESKSFTLEKIKNLVDTLVNQYGKDGNGNSKWTISDENAIATFWEGREWILDIKGRSHKEMTTDCFHLGIHYDLEGGIDFEILGASILMKKPNRN